MAENSKRPPMGGMGRKGGMGPVEKAKDFKGTMKVLIKDYLLKYKIGLIFVMVLAIGSTIFSIVGPKILGNVTTEIFVGLVGKISGGNGINFTKIANILLGLLTLYIISAVFSAIQGYVMAGISQKITYKLRNDLAKKIHKLPMNYFDKKVNGEILSVITNDIDNLGMNLNQSITQIITSIFTLLGVLIMMFSMNVLMTFASLLILPISVFAVKKIVVKSQKYFAKQQESLGHVNGKVEETYSGYDIVKAFNGEEKAILDFKKSNNELYEAAWKSQFLSGLMHPIMNFIGNIGYVMIALLGGYLTSQGKITVGNIQSFIQYNKQFTQPINQIAQISSMIQSMVASAERIFEFLNEKEEIDDVK